MDWCVVGSIIQGLKSQIKNQQNWIEELEKIFQDAYHEAYGKHVYKRKNDRASVNKGET